MTAAELFELIRNGEDSTLVYKRDDPSATFSHRASCTTASSRSPAPTSMLWIADGCATIWPGFSMGLSRRTTKFSEGRYTVEWDTLLRNLDLMVVSAGRSVATIDGLLLFGLTPNRYLPSRRAFARSSRTGSRFRVPDASRIP